jgi:hypothetical protein
MLPEVKQKVKDLRLDGDVKGGDSFIEYEEARLRSESSRDRDPLSLATRKLARPCGGFAPAEPDGLQEFASTISSLGKRQVQVEV